jgi:hypothetical protein
MQRGMVPFVPPLVVPGGSFDDEAGSCPDVGGSTLELAGSREPSGFDVPVAVVPPHAMKAAVAKAAGIRQTARTWGRMSEVV